MTLLDAKPPDLARERRRRIALSIIPAVVLILAWLGWEFRYWPQEHVVNQFFDALQNQDYPAAYGIWMHDPNWKQHPDQYSKYPYHEFYQDWGPGSEWGLIKSHQIYGSLSPKDASGVVVEVIVNNRTEHARVWVEKKDKTMSFSPY